MKNATAIKSQLEVMSGTVPSAAPQSQLARFIAADLKGGEAKQTYAMSVIRAAIEQAFKGNTRDIPEAIKLCEGKSVKARAYHAGFQAIAESVAPVQYKGKFDSKDNAAVREQVAAATHNAMSAFETSYLAIFTAAKKESDDKRAAKKAEKDGAAAAGAPAINAEGAPVMAVDAAVVNVAEAVAAVVKALAAGLLDAAEINAIAGALALHNMNQIAAQAKQPELQPA